MQTEAPEEVQLEALTSVREFLEDLEATNLAVRLPEMHGRLCRLERAYGEWFVQCLLRDPGSDCQSFYATLADKAKAALDYNATSNLPNAFLAFALLHTQYPEGVVCDFTERGISLPHNLLEGSTALLPEGVDGRIESVDSRQRVRHGLGDVPHR